MKFQHVTGTQETKPLEIDTVSSKGTVYIRRNIERVIVEQDETTLEVWEYDEAQLTPEEYEWYKRETDSPALDMTMQLINDLEANQQIADLTGEERHEEQMQLLNDIQADIAMISDMEV